MKKNEWFGLVKLIAWFSLILFLTDYANRTGKWWFHLIAMAVFVFTMVGIYVDIIRRKQKGGVK